MKNGIHPENYRTVIFRDMSNGYEFLGKSTAETSDKATFEDGNEYDLVKLDVTNTSHPFFTGKSMLVDTAGRIEKFNKKFGQRKKA